MTTWKAADAKRHFSQLLERAASSPQLVLLRGKPVGVVVGYEEFIQTARGWVKKPSPPGLKNSRTSMAKRATRNCRIGAIGQIPSEYAGR